MENEQITFEDLKKCVDWLYKTKDNKEYQEGYMDALYDMAATLGEDEELDKYHDMVKEQ